MTVLHLERLGHDQSLAVIRQETRGKKLPKEFEDQIIDRADGVPLFIEELSQSDFRNLDRSTKSLVNQLSRLR